MRRHTVRGRSRVDGPRPRMPVWVMRRSLLFVLLALILVLPPMAWACPIDPYWVPGIYDGGDFDDVIECLTTNIVAVQALPVAEARLFLAPGAVALTLDAAGEAALTFPSHDPRAPPLG